MSAERARGGQGGAGPAHDGAGAPDPWAWAGLDPEVGAVPPALARLDQVGAAALARVGDLPRTVDDAVAAPAREHLARPLDPGGAIAALARVVARGTRPGESAPEQRMRALVARMLELRHQLAAGIGRAPRA